MFWEWLINFLENNWTELALGAGLLWNGLKVPKTAEERKQIKANKATKSAEKAIVKAEKKAEKAKELNAYVKN